LADIRRRAAISHSASQNAVSRDTLVACPAIRTECLTKGALILPARTMGRPGNFSSAWRPAICRRRGEVPGESTPAPSHGSNYPLPDAVVDVIDRLVDLTASP
jgi:hypothetical protein